MKHTFQGFLRFVIHLFILTLTLSCTRTSKSNFDDRSIDPSSDLTEDTANQNSISDPKDTYEIDSNMNSFVDPNGNNDTRNRWEPTIPNRGDGKFQVIAGNFLDVANADHAVQDLHANDFPLAWHDQFDNSPYHTVIVQYTYTFSEAQVVVGKLRKAGIECYVNEKRFSPSSPKRTQPVKKAQPELFVDLESQMPQDKSIPAPKEVGLKKDSSPLPTASTANYDSYVDLYNVLLAEHMLLWQEQSRKVYNKDYEALTYEEQKAIRKSIPLVISDSKMFEKK